MHKGTVKLKAGKRRLRPTRDAVFMGIMRKTLLERLKAEHPDVEIRSTYGYITKYTRESCGMEKSHVNDALCIAKHPKVRRADHIYTIVPKRRHNRQVHKAKVCRGGFRKLNQTPKYVRGFRLFDKVACCGQEGFIFGRRSSGYFDIRKLGGEKISAGISYKKLTLKERAGSLLIA